MKRSQSNDSSGPGLPLKRSNSDGPISGDISEGNETSGFYLKAQNRSLSIELLSYKRKVADARRELELMRCKSREMESLVSVIQRSWSQLDIDASMLLDVLGGSESISMVRMDSGVYSQLLTAGQVYHRLDPGDTSAVALQQADQWSTPDEIDKEKSASLKALDELATDKESGHLYANIDSISDAVANHTQFTLSLLERICVGLSEAGIFDSIPDIVKELSNYKTFQAEKLFLLDRIAKLSANCIELEGKAIVSDKQRSKYERDLDKCSHELEVCKGKLRNLGNVTKVSGADSSEAFDQAGKETISLSGQLDKEYRDRIALLEKQLAESETAKSRVEMALTERLSRPLAQTEAQVADMRRAMEELRNQNKIRVSVLYTEVTSLQDKIAALETGMQQIERETESRCEQVVAETKLANQLVCEERDKALTELAAAKAEMTFVSQYKEQMSEYESLEQLARRELTRVQSQLKHTSAELLQMREHLSKSRQREGELEAQLRRLIDASDWSEASRALELGNASRESELTVELQLCRSSVDDLILEIEAIAADETKSREQNVKLVQQLTESQTVRTGMMEENLRLQQQVTEREEQIKKIQRKLDSLEVVMLHQDAMIGSLRKTDRSNRHETNAATKASTIESLKQYNNSEAVVELEQNMSLVQKSLESEKSRNIELKSRCDDLADQLEKERKQRQIAQREAKAKAMAKDKAVAAAAAAAAAATSTPSCSSNPSSEEATMLDMTLTMLRCSVCRDRFKDCAITRCFHLFCKECIDENLRNRHRKCPACGEKFGQDDVKSIYFTH